MNKPVIAAAVWPISIVKLLFDFISAGFSHSGALCGPAGLVLAGIASVGGFAGGIILLACGRIFSGVGRIAPISGLPEGEVNRELADTGNHVMFLGCASILIGMLGFFATIGSALWIKFLD